MDVTRAVLYAHMATNPLPDNRILDHIPTVVVGLTGLEMFLTCKDFISKIVTYVRMGLNALGVLQYPQRNPFTFIAVKNIAYIRLIIANLKCVSNPVAVF